MEEVAVLLSDRVFFVLIRFCPFKEISFIFPPALLISDLLSTRLAMALRGTLIRLYVIPCN
jgi:hypothetical protein